MGTKNQRFALRIIKFVSNLPPTPATKVMGYQLLKAGTSVGANYREANRAESYNDFIHKEAGELLAIFVASGRTAKTNRRNRSRR
ncbi:MAG: hypothetical protein DSY55_00385 [Clostridia bacterium]|nr:MAG: hypothetical protein DSY55_00385 [Clostridia bacterium]